MVQVDAFSGMYFAYFLKLKDKVFDQFCKFKAKYETLIGKRIKKLRNDICLEFPNIQLGNSLDNSGIFREKIFHTIRKITVKRRKLIVVF